MEILKYRDVDIVEDFLNKLFMESVLESSEILNDTYLSKLEIHKLLLDEYKDIMPILNQITINLIRNSNLNIDLNKFNVTLFSLASISNCVLNNAKFLIDHEIVKSEYEAELRSILEELKLNGIGNTLVKNLSKFYNLIIDMSSAVFKQKGIYDSLSQNNLLQTIDGYITKNKLSFDTFLINFEKLSKLIATYVKNGKLDKLKDKLSKKTTDSDGSKVLRIDELSV